MCLPYLKFSDPLPETHLFFLFCLIMITKQYYVHTHGQEGCTAAVILNATPTIENGGSISTFISRINKFILYLAVKSMHIKNK